MTTRPPQRRSALLLLTAFLVACAPSATIPTPSSTAVAGASPSSPPVALASTAPTASPVPTATAEPTPSPTPEPTPTPTPWKSYTSKRFKYSIKYPPDWVVTPGNASRQDRFDGFGPPIVFANRDVVSGTISISRTVSSAVAYMKSHFKAKLKSNKSIRLRGYRGRILTFDATDNGVKYRVQAIIVGKGRVGYFIEIWGLRENAKADAALFKRIYKTWRPKS